MNKDDKRNLEESLSKELRALNLCEMNTEEKTEQIQLLESLVKLTKNTNDVEAEQTKNELNNQKIEQDIYYENIKKNLDIKQSKKAHRVEVAKTIISGLGVGVQAIGITGSIFLAYVMADKGFKLEETGTYTSDTLKTLIKGFKFKI